MHIGIGDFVVYLVLSAIMGLLFGFIGGMGEGYKQSKQDVRRLKRQMDGHKYSAGDIVEVWVPNEDGATVLATISRVYHLLDGNHDYQLLLPGDMHQDVDEEDIKRRVTAGARG